jgi:2-polyprenyl-3-methyl-5-hydroxy-6-metoxy-1,4-benzoquinol methylase
MPDLRARQRAGELMDQPDLDPGEHRLALAALGRANLMSRTAAALWPAIRRAARTAPSGPLRLLDVATGGGHVAVALARRGAREGIALEITGIDLSAVAIDYACTLAKSVGVEEVRFQHQDALNGPWPGEMDVVISTLFLHHLDDDKAVALLARMKDAARRLVVVSDLRRSRAGYVLTTIGCRMLSRSRVFRVDGPRSVEAAFTTDEARALAAGAGLAGARLTTHWPARWLLTWTRERE